MRLATYIITILAVFIGGFNLTQINYNSPLEGDSYTAVITTICAGCAILMASILRVSIQVDKTVKKKQKEA